ncbi:MAG TPA: hypothetical protein VNV87_14720 [Acidimicrobiales bacterium]|nr:hypothetical protein [Acidimicrobiales bacterium]
MSNLVTPFRRLARGVGVRLLVCTALSLLAVPVVAAVSANPAGAYTVPSCDLILYTTVGAPGASAVGHAFVDLKERSTDGTVTHNIWGKYPIDNWYNDTKGDIKSNADTVWSWRISFPLYANSTQCTSTLNFINGQRKNPTRYRLTSNNCMAWARGVATGAAGITLPEFKDWLGIPSPAVFRDALKAAGNGNKLYGGTVSENKNNSTASGAPDPPDPNPPCCDAAGILQDAVTQPRALADELHDRLSVHQLGTDHLNSDGTYSVMIRNADTTENLYAVSWGDGATTLGTTPAPVENSEATFSHTYTTPPSGPLELFIVENGRVSEFSGPIQGQNGGSGHEATVAEPAPGPRHAYP